MKGQTAVFANTSQAGVIYVAGGVLLLALVPLPFYPSLIGAYVTPFLASFCAAGLAYVLALIALPRTNPTQRVIWGFALLFHLVVLMSPVSLSEDVYRYVWDGHLLNAGVNPYIAQVNSPLLDGYATELRARVYAPWMATPYLPAAQLFFALVEWVAPQSTAAFQVSATALGLAAGGLLLLVLRRLCIPDKALLVYLWNPLVVLEFSNGAHIDALMVFFVVLAVWGTLSGRQTVSALALAGGVLVKGLPALLAPLLAVRWGTRRAVLFGGCVLLLLAAFAAGAGWGLGGELDGRGVFGTLFLFSRGSVFNSGLYTWLEMLFSPGAARLLALGLPGLLGLWLGWRAWAEKNPRVAGEPFIHDPMSAGRRLARQAFLPYGLYLLLNHTIHPWYLTLAIALLPFYWPAPGEDHHTRRWIWPWVYFMFFEGFTYLVYGGMSAPPGLVWIQTAAYLPFWGLLIWAGLRRASRFA